jgi:DNA-binding FadR family transcriptional regulator
MTYQTYRSGGLAVFAADTDWYHKCPADGMNGLKPRTEAQREPDPIPRRKLSDGVLERLLFLIESGTIRPNEHLPSERELMSVYRVGRPAVREALQALQQMGIISISHGERARVIAPTPDRIFDQISRTARHLLVTSPDALEHLKEARLMFEQAMVRLAIRKASEANIAELSNAVDELTHAPRGSAEFIRADMSFHETIAAISGNPLFAATSKAMLDWLRHFWVAAVHQPGREELTLTEHQRILSCIKERNEEAAVQAITNHLLRANELYRKVASTTSGNS